MANGELPVVLSCSRSGGGQLPRSRRAPLVALAAAVIAVAATGCTGGGSDPKPSASSEAGSSDPLQASDKGTVRVAETGFEVTTPANSTAVTNRVAYGIVLENTSKKQVAFSVQLVVRLYDAQGAIVKGTRSSFEGVPDGARYVFPGERTGITGSWESGEPELKSRVVTKIDVSILKTSWNYPNQVTDKVTVSDVKAAAAADGGASVEFVTNTTEAVSGSNARASVIFRDSSSRIVGAARAGRLPDMPSGRSTQRLKYGSLPAQVDLAKTEVYVLSCCIS